MTESVSAAPSLSCRVIGSGPVGLAFCLFALRAGLRPTQIEIDRDRIERLAAPPEPGARPAIRRHLAISEGSRQLLDRIITFPQAAVIEQIDVELAGRSGRTRILASDFQVPALGHVLTHQALTAALARAVLNAWDGLQPQNRPGGSEAAGIDVHAEGAIEDTAAQRLQFDQSALLAEVRAPARRAGDLSTAWERFDRHGPLALLPIGSDGDRFAMVWCDPHERNAERQQWPRPRLDAELNRRFDGQLGPLSIEGDIELAPLTRVRRLSDPAAIDAEGRARVWIGNASQMLHPVAGQGLNLGLRDAFELARSLGDTDEALYCGARTGVTSAGTSVAPTTAAAAPRDALRRALAQFDRARRRDRGLLVTVTDNLARGFERTGIHGLQSTLLTTMDLLPALRRPLADTLLYGRRQ